MAKKIAPPNSGKHDVQSYLREGEDENTKYFNVEGKEFKDSLLLEIKSRKMLREPVNSIFLSSS